MDIQEFIKENTDKLLDYDGLYLGECVDLFRIYVRDVLKIPQPKSVTGAADFWANYETDPILQKYFDRINNTPSFIPKMGDIVIWNKRAGNGFGHIAICADDNGTTQNFTSFDQNWPKGTKCTLVSHDYKNVYGVLRMKTNEPEKIYTQAEWQIERDERNKNWDLHLADQETIKDLEKKIDKLEKSKALELSEVRLELTETRSKLEDALRTQAEATPEKAFEEIKQKMEEAHQQEILSIRMQQDTRIQEATKILEKNLEEAKQTISSLNERLLNSTQSWKGRMLSRKFLLTAPTALFNMFVAFAILFGLRPDPTALATALASLNGVVALFVVPEAITDHKQRLQK